MKYIKGQGRVVRIWVFEEDKGTSINDVTALRGINDFVITIIIKKRNDGGEGVKNYQKLRDIIYGRPLKDSQMIPFT